MTCSEFEAIVHDLGRPGALDEATHGLALLHAQTCDMCGARLAQARSLTAGLRALGASQAGEGAPPRIEAILHSAFLRQKWEAARARTRRQWTAVGIAAALVFGIGLGSRYLRKSAGRDETARQRPGAQTVPATSGAGALAPEAVGDSGAAQSDDDALAGFVPYPAGGTILPFESAQIVRVSFPGSALVAMGYPIDGDRAADRFTADVLVGEDGLPRAIRFTQ